MKDDPKFWEWLRNRNKVVHQEQQPRLELPMPPRAAPPKEAAEETDRGVCVIEIF